MDVEKELRAKCLVLFEQEDCWSAPQYQLTTYAGVDFDGTLTTISWTLCKNFNSSGQDCSKWLSTVRRKRDMPGLEYINSSEGNRHQTYDPFLATEHILQDWAQDRARRANP